MAEKIVIEDGKVSFITTIAGVEQVKETTLEKFYENFSQVASVDTGLIPQTGNGLLMLRSALGHTQMAYQYEPNIHYVNWGASEGSQSIRAYALAQPFRIVISDWQEGRVLGSRTFYSSLPIINGDEQMYHANLPNLNCKGYGQGNCLGWLCLYHNNPKDYQPGMSQKINHMLERSSGVESYNDANMSSTDGPRYYKAEYQKKHPKKWGDYEYLWNPTIWEKKSKAEGFDWIVDDNLLLPVLCDDMDHQVKHVDGGIPLTFNRAVYGHYSAYYQDKAEGTFTSEGGGTFKNAKQKPFNLIARKGESIPDGLIAKYLKSSIITEKPVQIWGNFNTIDAGKGKKDGFSNPIQQKLQCDSCKNEVGVFDLIKLNAAQQKDCDYKSICKDCYAAKFFTCAQCKVEKPTENAHVSPLYGQLCKTCSDALVTCGKCDRSLLAQLVHTTFGEPLCFECQPVYQCGGCMTPHKTPEGVYDGGTYCDSCGKPGVCSCCKNTYNYYDLNQFKVGDAISGSPFGQELVLMCDGCLADYSICSCKKLTPEYNLEYVPSTMSYVCNECNPANHQIITADDLLLS